MGTVVPMLRMTAFLRPVYNGHDRTLTFIRGIKTMTSRSYANEEEQPYDYRV
jgi:hypothetical protein